MVFSRLKSEYKKVYLPFIILYCYLMITQTLIKCEINIYPDHHSEHDPNFNRSQVKQITNESFYYDLGYFTNKTEKYRSPKYGLNYRPVKCEKMSEDVPDLIYMSNDMNSFFGSELKGIENITSTVNNLKNKFEETKLFRNTMKGYNFTCPSPIRSFYNENFEINFTIPMIADRQMTINVTLISNDGAVNKSIGLIELEPYKYKKVTFFIFPQRKQAYTSKMIFKFKRDGAPIFEPPLSIFGDPDLSIQFISNTDGNLILSNYRVTIIDIKTITGTPFNINTMIRSKNGLPNNCTKDDDCFIGFMCNYFNCVPCDPTCTECYQDDVNNPAGMNYCRECNVLSRNIFPKDGYCDIGYVDVTLFKDFEVKIKPDGQDFNDRETLGFWIFFSDTELSRTRKDLRIAANRERALKPEPEPEDVLHHIVLKDRFVITLIQRMKKFSVYCNVYENLFSRNTTDHIYFDQSKITGGGYRKKI